MSQYVAPVSICVNALRHNHHDCLPPAMQGVDRCTCVQYKYDDRQHLAAQGVGFHGYGVHMREYIVALT